MPKQTSSQWDFSGELFPVEATRRVFTVGELTTEVRQLLEKHIGVVWVSGEITNLRAQASGHVYFTLKDAFAQLSCIVFRTDPVAQRDALQDGRRVVLKGQMTLYAARGQYQLQVLAVELQGVGALQERFERLKQKLAAEGLFAPERKRPLPRYPRHIGLVTSPTGAAIRDVLHVIERRNPSLRLTLVSCAVQGTMAPGEIAGALRLLNEWSEKSGARLDAILVTRGGGSLEDLWAFNEEAVARAIHGSRVPVVSAVGHEIDFTISDFVADLRAATPSAAAELLTEGVFASARWIAGATAEMRECVTRRLTTERRHCQQLDARLQSQHPRRKLNERWQLLDDLRVSLARCARHDLARCRDRADNLRQRLGRLRPEKVIASRLLLVAQQSRALTDHFRHALEKLRRKHSALGDRLRLLGPEQTLARGYSITMDAASGKIVRRADEVEIGQHLRTRVSAGEVSSAVEAPR